MSIWKIIAERLDYYRVEFAQWLLKDVRRTDAKFGTNSITISPDLAPVTDLVRWSGSQAALQTLDLGMDATGRPSFFVGSARTAAHTDELFGGTFNDLSDVTSSGALDQQKVIFNSGTGQWELSNGLSVYVCGPDSMEYSTIGAAITASEGRSSPGAHNNYDPAIIIVKSKGITDGDNYQEDIIVHRPTIIWGIQNEPGGEIGPILWGSILFDEGEGIFNLFSREYAIRGLQINTDPTGASGAFNPRDDYNAETYCIKWNSNGASSATKLYIRDCKLNYWRDTDTVGTTTPTTGIVVLDCSGVSSGNAFLEIRSSTLSGIFPSNGPGNISGLSLGKNACEVYGNTRFLQGGGSKDDTQAGAYFCDTTITEPGGTQRFRNCTITGPFYTNVVDTGIVVQGCEWSVNGNDPHLKFGTSAGNVTTSAAGIAVYNSSLSCLSVGKSGDAGTYTRTSIFDITAPAKPRVYWGVVHYDNTVPQFTSTAISAMFLNPVDAGAALPLISHGRDESFATFIRNHDGWIDDTAPTDGQVLQYDAVSSPTRWSPVTLPTSSAVDDENNILANQVFI